MKNLINKRFNQLTVLSYSHKQSIKHHIWNCLCDCGNYTKVSQTHLTTGHTKSCGCFAKNNHYIHGMSNTRFHNIWAKMKYRCRNKSDNTYKHYGGRGIMVCDRWLKFSNFLDDMYVSYKEHCKKYGKNETTIDRINNDKGYFLDNCRWATMAEQGTNKRNNVVIEFYGQSLTMSQWARKNNIHIQTLHDRLYKHDWSIENALTKPVRKQNYQ